MKKDSESSTILPSWLKVLLAVTPLIILCTSAYNVYFNLELSNRLNPLVSRVDVLERTSIETRDIQKGKVDEKLLLLMLDPIKQKMNELTSSIYGISEDVKIMQRHLIAKDKRGTYEK